MAAGRACGLRAAEECVILYINTRQYPRKSCLSHPHPHPSSSFLILIILLIIIIIIIIIITDHDHNNNHNNKRKEKQPKEQRKGAMGTLQRTPTISAFDHRQGTGSPFSKRAFNSSNGASNFNASNGSCFRLMASS